MKELNLSISQTFSMTVDMHNFDGEIFEGPNGEKMQRIASFDFGEKSNELEIARKNGGNILYASTSIEKQIEGLLLLYFMGPFVEQDDRREIFENEILGSNSITFQFKKELIHKLIDKEDILQGKKKSYLQKNLKEIQTWRNAFAHGALQYDSTLGCLLNYYADKRTSLKLNDEFWDTVEKCFTETSAQLKTAMEKLQNKILPNHEMKADEI